MSWLPTGSKVLIKVDRAERKTASGIIIAEEAADRAEKGHMTGTVVALGPYAYHDQPGMWVKVGDRVKFPKFAGWLHTEDGSYRVMQDLDIIMVEVDDE